MFHVVFLTLCLTSIFVLMKSSHLVCLINDLKSFINNNMYSLQQRHMTELKGTLEVTKAKSVFAFPHLLLPFAPAPFCKKCHKTTLKELNQEAGF